MSKVDFEELYDLGEVDLFLSKAKEKCEKKLRGKNFAGMEKEDVIQEVLIKVYRSMESYDKQKAKMSTYINHVIENMVKDCFKKCGSEKNLRNVNALEIEDSYTGDYEESDRSSYGVHIGVLDCGYLEREVLMDIESNKQLTPRERQVFDLYFQGYAKVEIADSLGLTKARISQMWKEILQKIS